MGLNKVSTIAAKLIQYGKSSNTPMAIIDQGTTTQHKTYVSNLAQIDTVLSQENIVGPALIVVGDAIDYRAQVNLDMLKPDYFQLQETINAA